eukprot:9469348-Pyramimonas_sp.AAC.1
MESDYFYLFQKGSTAFNRFLTPSERYMIQGFDPKVTENIPPSMAVKASGSAFAMNCLGMCLACCLMDHDPVPGGSSSSGA